MDNGSVQLNIDLGPVKKEETDEIYGLLYNKREEIEDAFGETLDWSQKEGRRVCRIYSYCEIGGLSDEDNWDNIHNDMINRMYRLEKALKPFLEKI